MSKIPEEMSYSQFSQYFIECSDNLQGITDEVVELVTEDEPVPVELRNELHKQQVIVHILTQLGREKYKKEPKQLYNDGWNFWFKEDAELREKRYGGKSK